MPGPVAKLIARLVLCASFAGASLVSVDRGAQPAAEPVLEPPTLRSLGVYWLIQGDSNKNATVGVAYRKTGESIWQEGPPLFRVERGAHQAGDYPSAIDVPEQAWLFAGSLLLLDSDTAYELRLTLTDPDGDHAQSVLNGRTMAEPVVAPGGPVAHVIPGTGGGTGSSSDPYRGLVTAQQAARPGNTFLLHQGRYDGTFLISRSGEPGRPIVWQAAGDGEARIDGQGAAGQRPTKVISANDIHDVWLDGLTICNGDYGVVAHESAQLVIRRCHIFGCDYGVTLTRNQSGQCRGCFITDNVLEGPSTWPRSKGIENARGVQITGFGHVVCFNRIRGFADAIDTVPSRYCHAIDIHNNDLSELTDDGIEMDYSQRNTRCFHNRLTNVFQGISAQPVYGGPVYVFRNVIYNLIGEPFKLHNSPSGLLLIHNTCVKQGMPAGLWTSDAVRNSVSRNNLFVGTEASYAFESTAPMIDCDFDYDGFAGRSWTNFLKWNGVRYPNLESVRQQAPVYRHAVQILQPGVFASNIGPPTDPDRISDHRTVDLRLAADSAAIDRGDTLVGFGHRYRGLAPDLGAYECDDPPIRYGPRPM